MISNGLKSKRYCQIAMALLATFGTAVPAVAATYVQPKGDVVGQVQYATASGKESLADIARSYDIGLNAIISANPGLDPKRPAAGARVTIPSRHILPSGPREGIVINLAEMLLYYYYTPEPPSHDLLQATAAAVKGALDAAPAGVKAGDKSTDKVNDKSSNKASDKTGNKAPEQVLTTGVSTDGKQERAPAATIAPIAPIAPFAALGVPPPAVTPIVVKAGETLPPPVADPESMAAPEIVPQIEEAPVLGPSLVSVYPISIGPEARSIGKGHYTVEQRLSQPSWSVPAELRARDRRLPQVMMPGANNPLGKFSMVLNDGGYMIHGTNRPGAIGTRIARGSIAMYPEDIDLLIHRISTGTAVRIVNEPVKHGYKNGALYLELRRPEGVKGELNHAALVNWMSTLVSTPLDVAEWQRIRMVAEGGHGIAMPVLQLKAKPRSESGWWLQLRSYKTARSARAFINKIEVMEVPVIMTGCHDKLPCKVLAGPFKDKRYIEELRKKIKWVTGVKATLTRHREKDDFEIPPLSQKVASNP